MLIVFGSIYLEFLYTAERLLAEGETIPASDYSVQTGGKGFRQSLAAARWGVKTALVGRIGEDPLGHRSLDKIRRQGVMTSGIVEDDQPTGAIVRITAGTGKVQEIVATGANANTSAEQVPQEILQPRNFLLLHGELPAGESVGVLDKAKAGGATTVLHIDAFDEFPLDAAAQVDFIVVSRRNIRKFASGLGITGDANAIAFSIGMKKKLKKTVIVMDGPNGSVAMTSEGKGWKVPALPGEERLYNSSSEDCYCGTLVACLHDGDILQDAMRKANVAAALACGQGDAFETYPYRDDIRDNLPQLPAAEPITF